jgi:outer membrane protein TolC
MRSSQFLIFISVGALLALSPLEAASSQTASSRPVSLPLENPIPDKTPQEKLELVPLESASEVSESEREEGAIAQFSPSPTESPTEAETEIAQIAEPAAAPTVEPTTAPTVEPITEPTTEIAQTAEPAAEPVPEPTAAPTVEPTTAPTVEPITEPTTEIAQTAEPVAEPTVEPVAEPLPEPTVEPTAEPTIEPLPEPTGETLVEPVAEPTAEPTSEPASESESESEPGSMAEPSVTSDEAEDETGEPAADPATETPETPPALEVPEATPDEPSDAAADLLDEADAPAPEYLDPDPNPLLFPTQPDEVQIVGNQPITLEQAIELARRNNRELQISVLELERQQAALREQQAALWPTLDFRTNFNITENNAEPVTIQTTEAADDPAQLSLDADLTVNYDLFTSGARSARIRAAESQVRLQQLEVERTLEQLQLEVTTDYYDLQESDEEVRISQADLERAQQSLRDAEALERAGVGTRFDVLQAQVDLANTEQQLVQNLSQQQISRRQLAERLSLTESVDISAADPVEPRERWELTLEESIILAYRNRAELQQQLEQREVSDQQRRIALAALGPQISLSAGYQIDNSFNVDETEFSDQYTLRLQAQIRLFDGGAARANSDQEEANIAIAETRFAQARNQVRREVEQAFYSLDANFDNIQTTTLALQQATEALRLARLRFQAGVGTQTDVLRSQTELTRAERNQLRAILGYNRSLVQLRRAVSNFPDGELSDQPLQDVE